MAAGDLTASLGTAADSPSAIFDGVDDVVTIPDADSLSYNYQNGITICFWFCPYTLEFSDATASGDGPYVYLVGKVKSSAPARNEWGFRMYSLSSPTRPNRISFYHFSEAGGTGVGSFFQDTLKAGEWMHIAGSIGTTYTTIYKNGTQRDQDDWTGSITPANTSQPVEVGAFTGSSDPNYLKGAIRELKIFNRELTAAEVTDVYNDVAVPGLVHYWRLKDDFQDSVSGLHATNSGSVLSSNIYARVKQNADTLNLAAATDKLIVVPVYRRNGEFHVIGVNRA